MGNLVGVWAMPLLMELNPSLLQDSIIPRVAEDGTLITWSSCFPFSLQVLWDPMLLGESVKLQR